jgi:hypothetical protein
MWKQYKNTNYEISKAGEIRSIDRLAYYPQNGGWILKKGKLLKPGVNSCGYKSAVLYINGKTFNKTIHSLVSETFIGERPNGLFVNHIDGNKLNNHISNLEYVTPKENTNHAHLLGLFKCRKGENNPNAKLDLSKLNDIFSLRKFGLKQRVIADILEISQQTVSAVLCKKVWSHS